MNQAEQLFLTKIAGLAKLCGVEVPAAIVSVYDQALAPLGYENVNKALDDILIERSSRDPFPSVKEIRSRIKPESDPKQAAILVAAEIAGAIPRISPYEPVKARMQLSPAAMAVVDALGGWKQVVESAVSHDLMGTLKAQWRDLAFAQSQGPRVEQITLHEPARRGSLDQLMKKALEHKGGESE